MRRPGLFCVEDGWRGALPEASSHEAAPPSQPEQAHCVRRRCGGYLIKRKTLHLRDLLCDEAHVGGLVTLAAMRMRCKKRRIRLEHDLIERDFLHMLREIAVLERDDPSDSNQEAHRPRACGRRRIIHKTMQ